MENYYINKIIQLKKEYLEGKNIDKKLTSRFLPETVDYVKLDGSIHYKKDDKVEFIVNNNTVNKKKAFKLFLVAIFNVPSDFLEINFECSFNGICNIETIQLLNKNSKEWITKYIKRLKKYPDFIIRYYDDNGKLEDIHTKNSKKNMKYNNMTAEEFLKKIFFNANVDEQLERYNIEYIETDDGIGLNDFELVRKKAQV